ncbi:MAG: hypothetical protein ACK45H_14410, partial [Bacteroidota bacterium]
IASKQDPVNVTINNLFKKYQGLYFLPFFGESTVSELIAYAFSDRYVIYNARDVAALSHLGISLDKVRGEKFGDTFLRFNQSLEKIISSYAQFVGKRTNTTLQLEVDQFFSWLYETYISKTLKFNEIISQLKQQIDENQFVVKKESPSRFVWISDGKGLIGGKAAHYVIIQRKKELFVEIHFEETDHILFQEQILHLSEALEWFDWSNARSIRVKGSISLKDPGLIELLKDRLVLLDDEIGDQVRRILHQRTGAKVDKPLKAEKSMNPPLNQILYGPPGTGKTYSTIDKVVEICRPDLYRENDHEANKRVYDQLLKEGRVVFTTFHQSMSYEDFIEGIKPLKPGDEDQFLKYDVEPGILYQLA